MDEETQPIIASLSQVVGQTRAVTVLRTARRVLQRPTQDGL